MRYQRQLLSTGATVGNPAPLPAALVGLSDAVLADLPAAFSPCPEAWADTGFTPALDAPSQTFVVDVPTFMLRFTAAERIAIRKSQDPVVEDFMALLNDPRTARVNMQLPSVQQGVGYLAGLGGDPPLSPAILTPDRVGAVLAPEPV